MAVDTIEVLYDQLAQVALRFQQQSEAINQMYANLQKSYEPLANGDWEGKGAGAFFAKMTNEIFPSTKQLSQGLLVGQQITSQVIQIFQNAEQEAAALFKGGDDMGSSSSTGGGRGSVASVASVSATTLPPPRIYIVNGISVMEPDGVPNKDSLKFERYVESLGYDQNQITATPAVYNDINPHVSGTALEGTKLGGLLSPIDWLTGAGADAINGVTGVGAGIFNGGARAINTIWGVQQVMDEYVNGANGKFTQETYNFIQADLAKNPLLPGQQILLMGHSGGGAIVGNLAPMLERAGSDVGGVVTLGSPMVNADQIHPYAKHINITDENDFGQPIIRSEEARGMIRPTLAAAAGLTALLGGNPLGAAPPIISTISADHNLRDPGSHYYTTHSGSKDPVSGHLSFFNKRATTNEFLQYVKQEFPELGINIPKK